MKKLEDLFVKVKNHSLRVLKDYPDLHNKISAVFFFNKGLESVVPMKAMTGVQSNASVPTAGNATDTGEGKEGMARREHPPVAEGKKSPQSLDRRYPQGPDQGGRHKQFSPSESQRSQRDHPHDARGEDGNTDKGIREEKESQEEQKELVDEKELEELVADIGEFFL